MNNDFNSKKKFPKSVLIFLGLPIIMIVLFLISKGLTSEKMYNYSEIINKFKNEQVVKYEMNLGSGDMQIILKDGSVMNYTAPSANLMYMDIKEYVDKYNADHPDEPMVYDLTKPHDNSAMFSIVAFIVIPIISMIFMGWLFLRRLSSMGMGPGGAMSIGRSRAVVSTNKKVTFDDVAGAEVEKEDLKEIVDFLKTPEKYHKIGARIPRGVLLMGPPGTGKTLLAKAVAGEASVPFFSTSGSDFVEMYVGLGASRVRDLFEQAKKKAPCIIFIDEIDAVGRRRDSGINGAEKDNTLNQLLVEMDGFSDRDNVIVMAATNRPDILDNALMRPGRFDRQIYVRYPDIKEREAILKVHAKNKPFAEDVSFKTIAKTTAGFTGADLENLMNEAAILAVRNSGNIITMNEIEEACLKVQIGSEKKTRVMTEEDKKLTAYHESGHAIVAYFCKHHDKVHEISIVPRGAAGGYTRYLPEKDEDYTSKTKMMEELDACVAGMAAEKIVFNDTTTGASSDLKHATKIAQNMVTKYGMSNVIGPVAYRVYDDDWYAAGTKCCSEATAAKIDDEVRKFLMDSFDRAQNLLEENVNKLHEISKYLIENEKMSGEIFEKIMSSEI